MTIKLYSNHSCPVCKQFREYWSIPSKLCLKVYAGDGIETNLKESIENKCRECGNSIHGNLLVIDNEQMKLNLETWKIILKDRLTSKKEVSRLERLFYIPQGSLLGSCKEYNRYFIAVVGEQ